MARDVGIETGLVVQDADLGDVVADLSLSHVRRSPGRSADCKFISFMVVLP